MTILKLGVFLPGFSDWCRFVKWTSLGPGIAFIKRRDNMNSKEGNMEHACLFVEVVCKHEEQDGSKCQRLFVDDMPK
jgi:hypothetical protein